MHTAELSTPAAGPFVPTFTARTKERPAVWIALFAIALFVLGAAYWHSFKAIYAGATRPDSLYSHSPFIPLVSAFFIWRLRGRLAVAPSQPSPWLGYPILIFGVLILLLGDFLNFITLIHFSLLPVLAGLLLLFLGRHMTLMLWFPLGFLFFMLPLPGTLASAVSFESKILATESAVWLGQLLTLNLVQDGSYVYLGSDDRLLVGDVCGGMRSLVALLAFGALMAYISKTRWWARILILLVSPAVAILANVTRIFFLCVVGYVWGSEAVIGKVHDISGVGIFAIAFVLLFGIDALLRRIAPAAEPEENSRP